MVARFSCLLAAVLWLGASLVVRSDTVVLGLSADTTIGENALPDIANEETFIAGARGDNAGGARLRALLRVDLTNAIPPGSAVESVTLRVTAEQEAPLGSATDSVFELHRALRAWNETNATWNGPDTDVLWSSPGGQAGTDFIAAGSSSISVSGVNQYTFASTSNLVADVQAWVNDPASNDGWFFIGASEGVRFTARHFSSRQSPVVSLRPELTIVFTPGLMQPSIADVRQSGNQFQFEFKAQADVAYRVEFTDSLSMTNWQTLTNVAASPATLTAQISDTVTGPQRYYRVLVP